jgi:MFS family permease
MLVLGSGLVGGAKSMQMLIAARFVALPSQIWPLLSCDLVSVCITVQGLGGGGILSLTAIIIADLVPLRQRGLYLGST